MNDRTYLEDKLTRILSRRNQFTEHQLRLLVTGIEISLLGAEGEQVALGLLDRYRGTLAGWIDIKRKDGTTVTIDGTEYTMHRDPQETDDEYQERKNLFVDLEKAGGRLVIAAEDLPDSVIKRLQEIADEYPHDQQPDESDEAYFERVQLRSQPPRVLRQDGVMSGDHTIAGTRVRALDIIIHLIDGGLSESQIHEEYPSLPAGSVGAAVEWLLGKLNHRAFPHPLADIEINADYEIPKSQVYFLEDIEESGRLKTSLERLRFELFRATVFAVECAHRHQPDFAVEIGEASTFFVDFDAKAETPSLERLVEIYDTAAGLANWNSVRLAIREIVDDYQSS